MKIPTYCRLKRAVSCIDLYLLVGKCNTNILTRPCLAGSGSGSDSPSSLTYHSYETDEALNRRLQEEEAERENERRRAAALAIGDAQRRRLEAEASMHRAESLQNRRLGNFRSPHCVVAEVPEL